ncbi:MAG TPA: hypothetical protein VMG10_15485 [Gemmataceae bacterium]|nr:hypothetical protein [Gemmataceae bacterium]
MKPLRLLILLVVVGIALLGIRFWPRRTATTGAATPAQCLDAYYESLQSGDVDKYLRCLDEPYREDVGRRSFEAARRDVKDVKNLVQKAGPAESGSPLWVDEVRAAGVRRLRYHLRQNGRGWVIAAIDPPREIATPIRYGTHVGDEP